MTTTQQPGSDLPLQQQETVVIRFAGDSGDGMQITGNQFTNTSALVGNDLATLPDFPAEIRAPVGTRPGVSGFQIHFSSNDIHTPGDNPDVLVAMNPAALVVNVRDLKPGGTIIVNTANFKALDLKKAKCDTNPLEDGMLDGYRVIQIDINQRVIDALHGSPLSKKDVQRCKNFYTLGLMYWLYSRPLEPTLDWLAKKFVKLPDVVDANQKALRAGFNAGDIQQLFQGRFEVPACDVMPAGTYRNIMGNQALGLGLVAAAKQAGLQPFLGAYPITPATDILHQLAGLKEHGVITYQAEDEIAAICAALGASYAGLLGMTSTSGPGIALKGEAMGLAVSVELPLVIINIQRAGPSTGMPTKVEQADLYQSVFGRNGESPIPVVACTSPADAFDSALEACRIAVEFMTPVILLSDNYIANGSEPWCLPDLDALPTITPNMAVEGEEYLAFKRDEKYLRRRWATPGTPGLEHRIGGLEKEELTGNVCYDADNHQRMTDLRHEKIQRIADTIPAPVVNGPEQGDLLVLGWGSTMGAIQSATDLARRDGKSVANLHLKHLWPFPKGLEKIFKSYKRVLVPELNSGQLTTILRSQYHGVRFDICSKVQGRPFTTFEILNRINSTLEG